jgi:NDP-sugar pyrophosphorylase family protein
MILAAGLGTRLRPLSERLAKPLLPVGGRPLLDLVVERLLAVGVTEIAVNTHHLATQVAAEVRRLEAGSAGESGGSVHPGEPLPGASPGAEAPPLRFVLFHEPEILGTGGALWNARAFLEQSDTILLHNGDVLSDLDLRALAVDHRRSGALATLALTDWPQVNSVRLAEGGAVTDVGGQLGAAAQPGDRLLTYMGIAVLDRTLLQLLPPGSSSLVPALLAALDAHPGAVRGFVSATAYWNDLGTVGRYLDVHADILAGHGPRLPHLAGVRGPLYQEKGSQVAPGAALAGSIWIGRDTVVEDGAELEDCVLLPGARAAAGTRWRRAVLGDGWFVSEALNEAAQVNLLAREGWWPPDRVASISGHGSDRRFWRLERGDRRAVLMVSPPGDPEYARYVAIGRFLGTAGLGAPEILAADPAQQAILMEDLGADSLHTLLTAGPARDDPALQADLYRGVIDRLIDLQTRGTALAGDMCPLACDRLFDYATLRWETDYFRRQFLERYCGVPAEETAPLEAEFHRLALEVAKQPVVLMHRDFQSQNILFKEGEVRLVDFQGMRLGPLTYDLMALLRDAYVDVGDDLRDELRDYYRRSLPRAGGPELDTADLLAMAAAAGLQRNMQALGAFAYLSQVKGKAAFAAHVPAGLEHLWRGIQEWSTAGPRAGDLHGLERIVSRIRSRLST